MKTRVLALILAVIMCVAVLSACKKDNETPNDSTKCTGHVDANNDGVCDNCGEKRAIDNDNKTFAYSTLAALEYGADKDYVSVYDKFGADISIADVKEDADGFPYIEKDGKQYTLGLDFLTMAMVYNTDAPANSTEYKSSDDVYAKWWMYYIERWNYLLPEVPLYSNEYYDIYNTQITGVQNHPTNPYWAPASALIDWESTKSDKSIIIGNSTELGGAFRYASFGVSNPGAADLDVQDLTRELGTVVTTKEGGFQWNSTVVDSHSETVNADGSKTFTIKIKEGLKFSDGSAVTAKDYVVGILVFSTPVAAEAAGKDHMAGMQLVGYDEFAAYTGTAAEGASKTFSGVRLLGTNEFSVTISSDYIPYFYDISYASYTAQFAAMWIGTGDIKDDGQGCYLTDDFYKKEGDSYKMAKHITETSDDTSTKYPYSGPYVVQSYDTATKEATLVRNTYYAGNYEGTVPKIEKIIYKKVISATQLEDLKAGGIDVISGITGGAETNEAIALADTSADASKFDYIHYSRAGYGKLGFRCDFGAAQFTAVRQAIAYSIDRATFAKDFTGGYGKVTDGPYYAGSWMYKAAVALGIELDTYAPSAESAIRVLEADGWIYDANGFSYISGVRYKKIPAADISDADKTYQSKDGAYKTVKVGDWYLMPLVINWYGTVDNEFTDQLVTGWAENNIISQIGMVVQRQTGDFYPMLAELVQSDYAGATYGGTPLYSAFNFATGFTSAAYDYSYNMTIDPSMYDLYSSYYIKDVADIYYNK